MIYKRIMEWIATGVFLWHCVTLAPEASSVLYLLAALFLFPIGKWQRFLSANMSEPFKDAVTMILAVTATFALFMAAVHVRMSV